jgi:methionyl-tRNA synthetase
MTMVPKYRAGVVPAAAESQDIDQTLADRIARFPADLAKAYDDLALQQCVLLPIELARATNGYIDATAPFKLAKDPAMATRLDTVLNLATRAIYTALVGTLPVLPDKASAGLRQLGVEVGGRTLSDLLSAPSEGHKLGHGSPLFPKVE